MKVKDSPDGLLVIRDSAFAPKKGAFIKHTKPDGTYLLYSANTGCAYHGAENCEAELLEITVFDNCVLVVTKQ